jgi:hypothetical protein
MYRHTPSFCQTLLWSGLLASAAAVATAQTSPTTLMQINGNAASDNFNCSYELHVTPGTYSMEVAAPSMSTAPDPAPRQATPVFAPSSMALQAPTALLVAAPKTRSTSPSGNGAAPRPPTRTPSTPAMRPPIQHPTAASI